MKKRVLTTMLLASSLMFAQNASVKDFDHDGIPNNSEKILGTNPYNADTDGDGINDLKDKYPLNIDTKFVKSTGANDFKIREVLVENNYDEVAKKDASDHLEIILQNKSAKDISNFTLFYKIVDLKTGATQSYILPLKGFILKANAKKSIHIDTKKAKNHFGANPNSLYYNSKNKLKVFVTVNAKGYEAQSMTIKKDAGGTEVAD
ncbi:MAG: hypothetical protein GXP61_11545 [Epsilonproteobacteria bacterium]|nr:hypothetical protein [Campylobacterota bacterium]